MKISSKSGFYEERKGHIIDPTHKHNGQKLKSLQATNVHGSTWNSN